MNITVNIPALDRLCDLIESGKFNFAQANTQAKTEVPVKTKKAKASPESAPEPSVVTYNPDDLKDVKLPDDKPEPAVEATTPEPAPVVKETTAPAPTAAPTAEQAADLARAVVKLSSVSHLRNLLDLHIGTGVRITEADKSKIPALVEALNTELSKLQA